MLWQGLLQSLAPLLGGAVALRWMHKRMATEEEEDWLTPLGQDGVRLAVLAAVLLWVLPGGAFLVVPLALGLSLLSPAAREAWSTHRSSRLVAVGVALLCLGTAGWLPVQQPVAPEAWGQPLFTENPHAPPYPASEQYTWVTNDAVILQSVSIRLPHQPGVYGAEWTAMALASTLNMETSRMHQAIQLIDADISAFTIDPEDVFLEPVPAPSSLDVRLSSEVSETVEFRRYDIKTTAVGVDPTGTKVGEVSTASLASWGGQLDMLIVVRPILHPTLADDANGETYIRTWLNAHG
jgi:hypothetical protein